jgi:hypothetical protein
MGDSMNEGVINTAIDRRSALPAAEIFPSDIPNDAARKKVCAAAESLKTLEYDGDKIEPSAKGL